VRIATWNVNALTVERMERIVGWLDIAQPDVLCLQETKASDNGFPALGSTPAATPASTTVRAAGTGWRS
jgi:exodeoxyribonuclease-3